jgi:hypothetical protein
MLTVGDVDGDGYRDLFATDNTQLGGSGRFKQYRGLAGGFFETTWSWSYYDGYGSAVALADVDADGHLDLASGAWWDQSRLFLNTGSGLPANPSWSSAGTSVVEKIVFGDVDPACGRDPVVRHRFPAGDGRTLFFLPQQPVQGIVRVTRDGIALAPNEYTFSREHAWISVAAAPAQSLVVTYTISRALDMAISNWDGSIGNYLYYNLRIDDCNGNGIPDGCDVAGGASADVNANGVPDECECVADVDGSGGVGFDDLLAVLSTWGPCLDCPADLDADGVVGFGDLLLVLSTWGPCS